MMEDTTEIKDGEDFTLLEEKFRRWDRDLDMHWGSWYKEARECFDIFAGRSWKKEDAAGMEELGRVPVEFNRTAPLIKAVVGAEIAGRLRVVYKPMTTNDSRLNEVLTSVGDWIRQKGDFEGEESAAFMDALICGVGVTETRMDFEMEEDGQIVEDVVDPLEMGVDPSARKGGALDRRYLRRKRKMSAEEAKERFGDHAFTNSDGETISEHTTNPLRFYEGDESDTPKRSSDEVTVCEWQWFELKDVISVLHPETGQKIEVQEAEFEALQMMAAQNGRDFQHMRHKKRVYNRAFAVDGKVIESEELPTGKFSYNFITGDYDHNKGVWFGLVRAMRDPQRWANKFFSSILHILATNAKGGLIIEEDAVENLAEFEASWAEADSVSVVTSGAVSQGKIQDKQMTQYPVGMDRMMETAITAIRETAGVNPEFLGLANRDQPGVLEHQRKQAAYGIMATFFDSLRRFRKSQGELKLTLITFLPPGQIARVTMNDGENEQYVQMEQILKAAESHRFDVIVDEAPNQPNQKERTFAIIQSLLPMFQDYMTPEIALNVLEYSPLPTDMVDKIKQSYAQQEEDPEVQMRKQMEQAGMQLELQEKDAKAKSVAANARMTDAKRQQTEVETALQIARPDPQPQAVT